MSIQPVAGITGALSSMAGASGLPAVTGVGAPGATQQVSPVSFPDLTGAIDSLQAMQSRSDALAIRAVTGDLDDIHDYTIASAQAGTMFELTAAVRNKAVEAFTEIMRMQA